MNERWFEDSDAVTRRMCSGVNGYLIQELVRATGHCDADVADLFRQGDRSRGQVCVVARCVCLFAGARLIGELDRSGVGETVAVDVVKSVDSLRASCGGNNEVLLRQLREDDNSDALLSMAQEEAELGRLVSLAPLGQVDTSEMLLNPRFGVAQQKESGEWKVRLLESLPNIVWPRCVP